MSQPSQTAARTVLHQREIESDEDAHIVGNPEALSAIEKAYPYLLFKAIVKLDDTTDEWEDRSNRLPNATALAALIESYKTRGVQRSNPNTRILCGIRRHVFDSFFANENMETPRWKGLWKPRDDANTSYQPLTWGNRPKIQIIAGQHRRLALREHDPENLTWVCNIYDLDAMPVPLLIELGGNSATVEHAATMGEVFRDMAAVAPYLASQDTIIVRPYLPSDRPPTVAEYLGASRHGDKTKLQKTFKNALTVCAQQKSLDKLMVILTSPLREQMTVFVNSGVGMEVFSIDAMRDMYESQCFQFWNNWLGSQNQFINRIMGTAGIRHFDVDLLNKLAALGSRNDSNLTNLFWPSNGLHIAQSPSTDRGRSQEILRRVSNHHYRRIYDRLREAPNMRFDLMSRKQLQQFKSHNVPALRSVMDQVLRWLVPSGDFVQGATRYTAKKDLRVILQTGYFSHRNYTNNIIVADNLINLVAQIVFDHVDSFSPKASKGLDNYPTVIIKGTGDKENNISEEEYLTRFQTHFYWFHLAKSVARYVSYDLQEQFMRPFNDPNYHCFSMETTNIAVDLMEGRTSFANHTEVIMNPFLTGKEGKIIHQLIKQDIRESVVKRINTHLTQKVIAEGAHLGLREAVKDRVINDQLKFADLAKRYKPKGGPSAGHRRRHSERDDDSSDNGDDGKPDHHKPRSKWTIESLTNIDRATLDKFPPPQRNGNSNNEAADSNIHFNVTATKYVEMGLLSDKDKDGDDRVGRDEEEEGGVYLDANYKRVLVDGAVAGDTPPQKRGWLASSQQMRVGSGRRCSS